MTNPQSEKVKEIEQVRRDENYPRLGELCDALLRETSDPLVKSKVFYELHMAHRRQYEVAPTAPGAREHLLFALDNIEESEAEAELANDVAGVVFAKVNGGGYVLRQLGRWQEGMQEVREAIELANQVQPGSGDDWSRFERAKMSGYVFLIEIAAEHGLDHNEVAGWLHHLERNKTFQETAEKHPDITNKWVSTARDYIGRAR